MFRKKALPEGVAPADETKDSTSIWLRRKVLIILGLTVLSIVELVGGLVAALGLSGAKAILSGAPEESALSAQAPVAQAAGAEDGTTPPPPPGADLVMLPFEEMIVNITATAESGRQTSRFLKVDLSLVYDRTQDAEGLVAQRHVFMRDAFQDYLRQLADRDLEGTHGMVTLKGELLRRARAIAGSDAPHEILITGLVIQ
jgi:flagellar FliL protein